MAAKDTLGLLGCEVTKKWSVSKVTERSAGRKLRYIRIVLTERGFGPDGRKRSRVAQIRTPKTDTRSSPILVWLSIQLNTDMLNGRKIYDLR